MFEITDRKLNETEYVYSEQDIWQFRSGLKTFPQVWRPVPRPKLNM